MEWVETTASTVDDAKERALDELGVDEQDAEFEVIEEPRPGLFGRLRGEARVRARVRPRTPRPKLDRRDRRRRRRGGEGPAPRRDEEAGAPPEEASRDQEQPRPALPRTQRPKRRSRSRSKAGSAVEGREGERPATGRSTEGRRPQGRRDQEDTVNEDAMTEEDQAARAGEFLEGLAEAFDLSGSISTERVTDELIEVRLEGDDLGWMIGPKGATLQAVYDLAKAVVQREADGQRSGRFRIDIGGYRARRREALVRFTQEIAHEVRDGGEPRSLEPMGASDRKTVHDTVNEIAGVRTRSEGEEPRRRVVIEPDEG